MSTRWNRTLSALTAAALAVAFGAACAGESEEEAQEAASAAFTVERTVLDVTRPESVRLGPDGRYYVSEIGEFMGDGDGRILIIDPETWEVTVFAEGLDDPKGLAFRDDILFVTDRDRVVGLTAEGVQMEIGPDAFPQTPLFLNDLATGPDGALYASDTGEFDVVNGAIFRIDATGAVDLVISAEDSPEIASPNGVTFDPEGNLLAVDLDTGKLLRIEGRDVVVIAEGLGGGDGLEFTADGTLYVTDVRGGRVLKVTFGATGAEIEEVAQLARSADLGLDAERGRLLIPQLDQNSVTAIRLP